MMELAKIRSLSDEELLHQEKTSAEQLFRLRFQVSLGQNDGVKKLRELRKEIAQIKTVYRERELGVRGATHDTAPAAVAKTSTRKSAKASPKKSAKASPVKRAKTSKKKSAKTSTKTSAKKGAGK
jgi:large subunit ribosomal protein L29